ncbi:hypothetical protein QTG56_25130 (plasmid) [Rossellomorea sp. AcN35-11]|nr:hypothetical protein [Rossellomorea aquimaris]WJV31918.1 hypothetical protein QTG56_25130 [Rossellomorea sp. AcN35-11]
MSEKSFDEWIKTAESKLFKTDHFKALGKEDDFIFQALAFAGKGNNNLSLATTLLSEADEVPEELKSELKSIQEQLHQFREKLRLVPNPPIVGMFGAKDST